MAVTGDCVNDLLSRVVAVSQTHVVHRTVAFCISKNDNKLPQDGLAGIVLMVSRQPITADNNNNDNRPNNAPIK